MHCYRLLKPVDSLIPPLEASVTQAHARHGQEMLWLQLQCPVAIFNAALKVPCQVESGGTLVPCLHVQVSYFKHHLPHTIGPYATCYAH